MDGRARKRAELCFTRPISISIGSRSRSDLHDKVLLPILGDQYGRVLERGELQVHFDGGAFSFAISITNSRSRPGTYRHILEIALENLAEFKDEEFYAEFQSILTALEYLPRSGPRPIRNESRSATREKEIIKRRLERRCAGSAASAARRSKKRVAHNQRACRAIRAASIAG